ncbi:MAG: M15 family metallopeptidase [Bacilli bacterium]|jgi:D-alanyl-D-alanine carboxypeptidase|nr:M15 family metallopeptidase [Bacilli bacterium]
MNKKRKSHLKGLLVSIIIVLLIIIILLFNAKNILLMNVDVNNSTKNLIKQKLSINDIMMLRKSKIYDIDSKLVLSDIEKEISLDDYNFSNQEMYSNISLLGATNQSMIVKKANEYLEEGYSIKDIKNISNDSDKKAYFVKLIDKGIYNQANAKLVLNPSDNLAIANYENSIYNYQPSNLVKVTNVPTIDNSTYYLKDDAYQALEKMCSGIEKEFGSNCGSMVLTSAYRSYDEQEKLYNELIAEDKENISIVQPPGESEHQLGNSIDFALSYVKQEDYGNTEQFKWVKEHAADYGFIIRYPENKEDITKIEYEPWHLRYVGIDIAKDITSKGLCLEEYVKTTK